MPLLSKNEKADRHRENSIFFAVRDWMQRFGHGKTDMDFGGKGETIGETIDILPCFPYVNLSELDVPVVQRIE